jgi:hypothetical protein
MWRPEDVRALLIAAVVSAAAGPALAQSVHVPTGEVHSIDMKMADSRLSDEGLIYTSSDQAGRYRFRPEAGGPWVEMSLDEFEAHVRERLGNVTRREVPQFQDWVVRYTAADGQAVLWRAGLRRPAVGRWELRRISMHVDRAPIQVRQLCFSSAVLDGQPLRETDRDGWVCDPAAHMVAYPEVAAEKGWASRPGDVFGLASGRAPYVLQPETRPEWPAEATQ